MKSTGQDSGCEEEEPGDKKKLQYQAIPSIMEPKDEEMSTTQHPSNDIRGDNTELSETVVKRKRAPRPLTMFINSNDDLVEMFETLNQRDLEMAKETNNNNDSNTGKTNVEGKKRSRTVRAKSTAIVKRNSSGYYSSNDQNRTTDDAPILRPKPTPKIDTGLGDRRSQLIRNSTNRRSLTDFFSRNSDKKTGKKSFKGETEMEAKSTQ